MPENLSWLTRLDQTTVKEYLRYDPNTGIFTWKIPPKGHSKGDIAGQLQSSGYITISLLNKTYTAHRLAWFHFYGFWPKLVDHKNRKKTDNRIRNLRDTTHSENQWNSTRCDKPSRRSQRY